LPEERNAVDPVTFESLTRNPDLLDALMQQARRERAEAVYRLIVLPLKRLFVLASIRMHAPSRSVHVQGRPI